MWRETETDSRYASSVTRFGTYESVSEEGPLYRKVRFSGSFQGFDARVVNEALSRFHYLLRLTRGSDGRLMIAACGARATTCRRPWGSVETRQSLGRDIWIIRSYERQHENRETLLRQLG